MLPPPKARRERYPGLQPLSDRRALTGVVFVLKRGILWEILPQELGCDSGVTYWRRLRDWQEAGVWQRLHKFLLSKLRATDQIVWPRAVVDSGSVRAVGGGEKNGTIVTGPETGIILVGRI